MRLVPLAQKCSPPYSRDRAVQTPVDLSLREMPSYAAKGKNRAHNGTTVSWKARSGEHAIFNATQHVLHRHGPQDWVGVYDGDQRSSTQRPIG